MSAKRQLSATTAWEKPIRIYGAMRLGHKFIDVYFSNFFLISIILKYYHKIWGCCVLH